MALQNLAEKIRGNYRIAIANASGFVEEYLKLQRQQIGIFGPRTGAYGFFIGFP